MYKISLEQHLIVFHQRIICHVDYNFVYSELDTYFVFENDAL